MPRIAAPDGAVAGMEIRDPRTDRIKRYDGRIMDVDNPMHVKALVGEGAFLASLAGTARRSTGYRCACGFGSYLPTCSRCGGTCSKES